MLAETLQRLIEEKVTCAREIGEFAGVSTSTVYRWVSGESQPDFNSIRLLLRHLPDPRAQEALLSAFAGGTHWQFSRAEMDLDVNDDGHINVEDALDASVSAVRGAAESLVAVRENTRGEQFNAEQTLEMITLLNQVVSQCTVAQRVLMQISEKKRRRLKLVE